MLQGEEYICTYSHILYKFLALLVSTLVFELKSSAPQISVKIETSFSASNRDGSDSPSVE